MPDSNTWNLLAENQPRANLLPLLYEELRVIARQKLRGDRIAFSLRPTELVHEAFLRFDRSNTDIPGDPVHYLALMSGIMRHLMVDRARSRHAQKRGGQWTRIPLDDNLGQRDAGLEDLLALEKALVKLERLDPRGAAIVEMRFFGGMQEAEIAQHFSISDRWVRKQWAHARAWLYCELGLENG